MRGIMAFFVLLISLPAFAGTFRDNFEDGDWEGWNEAPFLLKVGQWYRFKETVKGDKFTLFIDGENILTFNEGQLANGKVGFGALGCKARFDNIVITGDDVPDAGPSGFWVEPKDKLPITWAKIKDTR